MNILFIHQNFPGQFKQIAPALVGKGHKVRAMTMEKVKPSVWQGVEIHPYTSSRSSSKNIHPWITDFETKVIRGEACYKACVEMKAAGYVPDIIIAHPGWGESFFMKEVWPDAKLGIHCEFYYHVAGTDLGFDDEFPYSGDAIDCRIRLKNLVSMMHFDRADRGISPTQWQAGTYPEPFRERISVIHEGIDTDVIKPFDKASLTLNGKIKLSKNDEIITYVNRNLEPMRGFHIFMRALPELLKRRPKARILIPGSEAGSYGPPPKDGGTWKKQFIAEVRPQISDEDWARVHFLGKIRHDHFTALLQLSTVVQQLPTMSWSMQPKTLTTSYSPMGQVQVHRRRSTV